MAAFRAAFSLHLPLSLFARSTETRTAESGSASQHTMACDRTLNEHLRSSRALTAKPHVILGNESADLDSVACTLALSFVKTHPTLPVLNLNRGDLHLRPDVVLALQSSNVEVANLCFLDDAGIQEAMCNAAGITLVDHNSLAARQTSLASCVTAIIDHHSDEGLFRHANPRTIVKTGSCATLVSEYANHLNHDDSSGGQTKKASLSPDCARLLLSAVLLDCLNMDASAGKATSRDIQAAQYLRSIAALTESQADDVFQSLSLARADVSTFSTRDLLRKDAKVVKVDCLSVVISSVPVCPFHLELCAHKRLTCFVEQFARELNVSAVIVLLGFERNGAYNRDLLVSSGQLGDALASRLLNDPEANILQLEPASQRLSDLHHFHQVNSKASRKVVLPIVKSLMLSMPDK